MSNPEPTKINQKQFTRLFMDSLNKDNGVRFCFLIGAGASSSSYIPTGQELAESWYQQILEDIDPQELKEWKDELGLSTTPFSPDYHQIFQKRFQCEPGLGYKEIQSQIQGAQPGIGYIILAKILEKTQHNFVITTNIDRLIDIALLTTSAQPPLICQQERLSIQTQVQTTRPIVIRTHHDFNKSINEASVIGENCIKTLTSVLENFRLVVIGSAGNDKTFMDFMGTIDPHQREKIYWCTRHPKKINKSIQNILSEGDYLVKIEGFDEFMYQLSGTPGVNEAINNKDIENSPLIIKEKQRVKWHKQQLQQLAMKDITGGSVEVEAGPAKKTGQPPTANNQTNPKLFEEYDNNAVMQDLLSSNEKSVRLQHDESYYKIALESDPDSIRNTIYYAILLDQSNKDDESATNYYKKALALAPDNAKIYALYAFFLVNTTDDYDTAEEHYIRALELSPNNAAIHILYSLFLYTIRKNYALAQEHNKKGFEAGPQQTISYNDFLRDMRNDYQSTGNYYRKALEFELENEYC